MLMICGAALTGAASWLVLQEAGVPARGRFWWRALHVLASWFAFQGLIAPLGEFAFGVPQFGQAFHPLLLLLAGGVAVLAMRLVLGPWWALGITGFTFFTDVTNVVSGDLPAQPRAVGMYVGMAAVVEVVALLVGTERRTRFAVATGLGLGTVGLASEWLWNQSAYQPWRAALLPEALALGIPMAVAASFLGLALAGRRPGRGVLVASVAVVLLGLAWPMPRPVGDVAADLRITPRSDGLVQVEATLKPADAADHARWFQVSSWQGGDLLLSDMEEVAPGRWVSQDPVPVGGNHKSIIRLHRGHQMMAVPVYLPADPAIDEPEIPAEDRVVAFGSESTYLLRETEDNDRWLAWATSGLLATVAVAWLALFGLVVRRVAPGQRAPERLIAASSVPR